VSTQPQANRCPQCGKSFSSTTRICPDDGTVLETVSPTAAQIGTILDGKYRLDAFLSHGGMGSVFKATHVMLNRTVAVKLINQEIVTSPDIVRRFQREARAATTLNHPNITGVYDLGQTSEGTLYIAMEFIDGPTLKAVLKRGGAMPAARIVAILRQVAAALAVAHRHGIVHRDLKPHNIMLVKDDAGRDVVKLVDFGIAKTFDESTQLTQTGFALGTPQYMAPEQAEGKPVDGRSDVYSLGVILYEMLAGDVPFTDQSTPAILIKHIKETPKLPSLRNPDGGVSPQLEAIAMRCLEKDPANRFQTAEEFATALEAVDAGNSAGAQSAAAATTVMPAATLPLPARAAGTAPAAWDYATAAAPAQEATVAAQAPTVQAAATGPAASTVRQPTQAAQPAAAPQIAAPPVAAPPAAAPLAAAPLAAAPAVAASPVTASPAAAPAASAAVAQPAARPASTMPLVLVLGGAVIVAAGTAWFMYGPGLGSQPAAPAASTAESVAQASQPPVPAAASPSAPEATPPSAPGTPPSNAAAPANPPAQAPAGTPAAGGGNTGSPAGRPAAASPVKPASQQPAPGAAATLPATKAAAATQLPAAQPPPPPFPADPAVAFRCSGPLPICSPIRNAVDEVFQKAGFTLLRVPGRADVFVDVLVAPVDEHVSEQFGTTFVVRTYSIDVTGEAPRTGENVPMPSPTTLTYDAKFGSERVNEKARLVADGIVEKVKAYAAKRR
jgi:predicted Ser/Thr protein kinase